jgi:hypothetical protein
MTKEKTTSDFPGRVMLVLQVNIVAPDEFIIAGANFTPPPLPEMVMEQHEASAPSFPDSLDKLREWLGQIEAAYKRGLAPGDQRN